MSLFGRAQKSLVAVFLRWLFRVKVIDPGKEPQASGYIVAANHSSNYDAVVLGAATTRPIRYMAKSELFRVPLLRSLIRAFGAFPVNRNGADVSSIRNTIEILKGGQVVGMYPSGGRTKKKHPEKAEVKSGVAMAAIRAKTGVFPVSLVTRRYKVRMFHRTKVVFGDYIPYETLLAIFEEKKEPVSAGYRAVSEYIYGKILENYDKHAF